MLAISDINVYEIVQRDDDIQISRICDFVNMIDVDFINTNIFDVIEKEKSLKNGTIGIIEPWRDYEMIERYNTFCGNSTHYDIKSFILKSREAYKTGLIKYQFASNFNPIIEKFRKINRFINNKGLKNFPCTEWLNNECINYLVKNISMNMSNKEWLDFFHLIVPVAYCKSVFLDKRWFHAISTIAKKNSNIACIYDKRRIESFFQN